MELRHSEQIYTWPPTDLFDLLNVRAELQTLKVNLSKQVSIYRMSTPVAKLRNAIVIIWQSGNQVIGVARWWLCHKLKREMS